METIAILAAASFGFLCVECLFLYFVGLDSVESTLSVSVPWITVMGAFVTALLTYMIYENLIQF